MVDKSVNTFEKYKAHLHDFNELQLDQVKRKRLDTVGAVCIDLNGRIASGVSSGGLILKSEGRVGQSSVIGAGCWSQNDVAVTTSGVGEYIIRTFLAKECATALIQDSQVTPLEKITSVFNKNFFGNVDSLKAIILT